MVNVQASNAFAVFVLIGCGGGVIPRSTNKIARIPFKCRFLTEFFLSALAVANLFWFWLEMLSSSQKSDLGKDQISRARQNWHVRFLKIYSSVLVSINSD